MIARMPVESLDRRTVPRRTERHDRPAARPDRPTTSAGRGALQAQAVSIGCGGRSAGGVTRVLAAGVRSFVHYCARRQPRRPRPSLSGQASLAPPHRLATSTGTILSICSSPLMRLPLTADPGNRVPPETWWRHQAHRRRTGTSAATGRASGRAGFAKPGSDCPADALYPWPGQTPLLASDTA